MISSIFGKTKPINFVLVLLYLLGFFLISFFLYYQGDKTVLVSLQKLIAVAVIIFSIFLIDFISKKNTLTRNNSYVILLFVFLVSMFPEVLLNDKVALANLFIILAARRCLGMKLEVDLKKKIFDASFWIGCAALFCNWSLLAIILVYFSIGFYASKDYKNWLIPLIAFFSVSILFITYLTLSGKPEEFVSFFNFNIGTDLTVIKNLKYTIPFFFILSIGILSLIHFFINLKAKTLKTQISILLTTLLLVLSIGIALLTQNSKGATYLFMMFPIAVLITNYLEAIQRNWYKEFILWIFLLLPLSLLLL